MHSEQQIFDYLQQKFGIRFTEQLSLIHILPKSSSLGVTSMAAHSFISVSRLGIEREFSMWEI